MAFRLLDTVVLTRDIPDHALRAGDLGAIVEVYSEDALEVEFLRGSGETTALLTLRASDVRAMAETDVPAVRSA